MNSKLIILFLIVTSNIFAYEIPCIFNDPIKYYNLSMKKHKILKYRIKIYDNFNIYMDKEINLIYDNNGNTIKSDDNNDRYEYYPDGKLQYHTWQNMGQEKITKYYYDDCGRVFKMDYGNFNWIFYYNNNNKVDSIYLNEYNEIKDKYITTKKQYYKYINQKVTEDTYDYVFEKNEYILYSTDSYLFNLNNELIENKSIIKTNNNFEYRSEYNHSENGYIRTVYDNNRPNQRFEYIFNEFGDLTKTVTYNWNEGYNCWILLSASEYIYKYLNDTYNENIIKNDISYKTNKNSLTINNLLNNELIYIYDIKGVLLKEAKSNNSTLEFQLPKGIYIIRINNKSDKIIIP